MDFFYSVVKHLGSHKAEQSTVEASLFVKYKVVKTFKSADNTLVCDHSNESY